MPLTVGISRPDGAPVGRALCRYSRVVSGGLRDADRQPRPSAVSASNNALPRSDARPVATGNAGVSRRRSVPTSPVAADRRRTSGEEQPPCPSRPSASSSRPTTRNFGRFGDAVEVPPLTDVQTRSYDRFLQLDVPHDKRDADRPRRRAAGNLPDRELRQEDLARVHQVRPRQAALRPRRVPPAPPDLRPARSASGCACARPTAPPSRKKSTSATCRS